MNEWFDSPLVGIVMCSIGYLIGVWVLKKTRFVLFNPLLIACIFCMVFMSLTGMTLEQFNLGASVIQAFLAPATCVLALSIYRQRKVLQTNFIPVVCGCFVSSVVSMASAYFLCRLFQLDQAVTMAVLPKSVTTAIAVEVTEQLGGIVPITILCVIITGIAGAMLSPFLIKLLRIQDPATMGVAIGASSHVIGTTKAMELGEIQGAMSSVAIGVSGLITMFLALFLKA